jgi:hypothetical protein
VDDLHRRRRNRGRSHRCGELDHLALHGERDLRRNLDNLGRLVEVFHVAVDQPATLLVQPRLLVVSAKSTHRLWALTLTRRPARDIFDLRPARCGSRVLRKYSPGAFDLFGWTISSEIDVSI